MRNESMFPYSYVIEAMDKYFGMHSPSSPKKKNATRERYVNAKPKVLSKKRRLFISLLGMIFCELSNTCKHEVEMESAGSNIVKMVVAHELDFSGVLI